MADKIKVTLTGTRPVKVDPDFWPMIASADDKDYDGQYDFQATRMTKWKMIVRQHAKGCALVYGIYSYDSQWQGARSYDIRGGVKLEPGADLAVAIREVAADMESAVKNDRPEHAVTFRRIARECIGDLPPIEDFDCASPEVLA